MRISRKLGLCGSSFGITELPSYTGSYKIFGDVNSGTMELYSSGVLTFAGKSKVKVFAVGGGSSGLRGVLFSILGDDVSTGSGGGGGQGGYTATGTFTVSGDVNVTIGAGGAICSSYMTPNAGESTSFGTYLTAAGGGKNGGGSGGGGGSVGYGDGQRDGFDGGSDGENGENGGNGQESTTRAFGDANGTLYAGGGGGGGVRHEASVTKTPGMGGEGGGGDGGVYNQDGASGAANTGGGGGGGGCDYASKKYSKGGAGGSGIVIIKW